VSLRGRDGCVHSDVRACELTPHGATLGAASGRSQARTPEFTNAHQLHADVPASELAGLARSQGCLPAQPARPAGGPVAIALSESIDGVAQRVADLSSAEAQPTRLGDRQKRNPPRPNATTAKERRRQVYALQDGLRPISAFRVAGCGRRRIAADVDVKRRIVEVPATDSAPASKKFCAYFSGVHRCGSVWECPVCSARIRVQRAEAVARAVEFYGFEQTAMLTLTVRHGLGHDLKAVRVGVANAYRRFTRGEPWKRFKAKYAVEHSIRALEVTHGAHGWHPHIHALLFLVGSIEQVLEARQWIRERWAKCVRAELGEAFVPNCHGVDLRQYQHAEYIAKVAAWEIVDPGSKKGRGGNRSPAQIAADFVEHAAPRDAALWQAYCAGMRGAKMLEWSRGLAQLVAVREDESAADNESEQEDEIVATIRGDAWDRVRDRRAGFRCEILEAAEGARDVPTSYAKIERLLEDVRTAPSDAVATTRSYLQTCGHCMPLPPGPE